MVLAAYFEIQPEGRGGRGIGAGWKHNEVVFGLGRWSLHGTQVRLRLGRKGKLAREAPIGRGFYPRTGKRFTLSVVHAGDSNGPELGLLNHIFEGAIDAKFVAT
jgi:hypothetical protein